MDASEEEIFQPVCPEKKPSVDGGTLPYSPTQAAAVTKVLDDDNLLREIIVRVGFPTTLVCAALVCKRWLEHASDRKFLSRFRELHPARLLGYYITEDLFCPRVPTAVRFVPMLPQPPELTAVIRRLESFNLCARRIMHCCNGSVFTEHCTGTQWTHGVHRPLCAEKGMQFVPPLPCIDYGIQEYGAILSKEEASGMFYFYVLGEYTGEARKSTMRVYMFQDSVWCTHTSVPCPHHLQMCLKALFVGNKIYMLAASGDEIIVLDLTASSFSTIQLPEGVKYHCYNSRLSCADDVSSVYLIHVMGCQLCIWLHRGDNWLLIDTICLNEMLATLKMSDDMPDHTLEDEGIADLLIRQVGDYATPWRRLKNNDDNTLNVGCLSDIHPFMMVWPPTFPALKGDSASKLSDGR